MKRHDYYFRQKVTHGELDEGFDYAENADHALATDPGLFGVCFGFGVAEHSPAPDLTVDVDGPGAAYDQYGQRIAFAALQTCDVSEDSDGASTAVINLGNEKYVSVFIKFKRVNSDPRLDGAGVTVYFTRDESWEFIVRQGAEAAIGAATPPALEADAVLLSDVRLIQGQTQVLNADIYDDRRQSVFVIELAGRYTARLMAGQLQEAIATLTTLWDAHVSGTDYDHLASDINYEGGGAWHDGTTNPAATVEAQLDKIITDLVAAAGSDRLGSAAVAQSPTSLSAGSIFDQLTELLTAVNARVLKAGDTISGDLLPHADGGVDGLGDGTHHWNVFAFDVTATGAVSAADGFWPGIDTAIPDDYYELTKRNVPLAWGKIDASALADPHYNVASVTHTGAGIYTVVLDTHPTTHLVPVVTPCGTGQRVYANVNPTANDTFEIHLVNDAGAHTDCNCTFVVFGF